MQKKGTSQIFSRNKLIELLSIIVILLTLPNRVNSQTHGKLTFTLKEAQQYAIKHNYDTRNNQMDIEAAKKKIRESIASGLPQISSSFTYNDNLRLATSLIPNFFAGKPDELMEVKFGRQHNASANIRLDQLVFSGSYLIGLQAAKSYLLFSEQNLEKTQIDAQELVTNTYYLILISEESKKILDANLANLEQTLYEIKERYKEGFVEATDVDQVQISVTNLKNSIHYIARQIEIAYMLLKFQMGLDLEQQITLTDELEQILNQVDVAGLIKQDFDLENNINYKLLNTQERLAELSLKNEKVQYWPTVSAYYYHTRNAMRDSFNFFDFSEKWYPVTVAGFKVDFPIYRSGFQKSKVKQAEVALKKVINDKRKVSQSLLLEVARTKKDLATAHENYLNAKDNVSLAERVYNVTLIKYREGISSSMDLIQAHNQYLLAESDYITMMSELLNAKNSLDKITNNY
jgi:outer membrane protein